MSGAALERVAHRESFRERGQSAIEFAITIAMLLTILLGTVDFARLLYFQTSITSAARVAAEVASNHCEIPVACGNYAQPTTYDFVLQAADCDASGLGLQPAIDCQKVISSGGSPCAGSCPPPCAQDMCVSPSFNPGSTQILSSPQDVTVSVGYNFSAISPFFTPFLESDFNPAWKNGCFPGDPPHTHTLCAQATGRIG